ncbi:MAG: FecR domain-containing protein [Pseudobdellovibrionaceae bacterium]
MKKFIMAFSISLVCASTALAQEINGVFMVVKGDVKISNGAKIESAKVGSKVKAGDTVSSGPDSRAKIVMADKNILNISPDTKITIEKYTNDAKSKEVELNVQQGKVRATVEQKYDGEKSKFNIKTPSAVAGVRGTDFLTTYNPQTKVSSVITFHGTVAVGIPDASGRVGQIVLVQPGQKTEAKPGLPPEPPKAIPQEQLQQLNVGSQADLSAKQDPAPAAPAIAAEAGPASEGEKSQEPQREPASAPAASGGLLHSSDLSPEVTKDVQMMPGTAARNPATYLAPPPVNFIPPNSFVNDAIRGTKVKTNITITPGP